MRFESVELVQVAQSSFQRRGTVNFELRAPLQVKQILDHPLSYQLFKKYSDPWNYAVRVYNVSFCLM
jgi:hypothetical protein